jgi:uncharacterized membrane protein YfcA
MLYVLSGLVVGTIVGLTGVGGGSLMTPILVMLFGLHPATAVGTDLLYAAATKSVGTFIHGLGRTIAWRVTALLSLGSVPAATGMILAQRYWAPSVDSASVLITSVLGASLLLTSIAMMLRKRIRAYADHSAHRFTARTREALTVVIGLILGVLVSISSVGAGALGVTALILLYPRLPTARIVGSDIAHAVPLTLIAGFGHWLTGHVEFALIGQLLTGSIPGIIAGSLLAPRLPEDWLRRLLAAVLAIVGARLLIA